VGTRRPPEPSKLSSPDLVFDPEAFLPRAVTCHGKQLAGYVLPDHVHAMNRDVQHVSVARSRIILPGGFVMMPAISQPTLRRADADSVYQPLRK